MKNKFYLKEFQFFDGEDTVVFNIIAVDGDKITVVVSKCGKISVSDYDLHTDKNGLYFEYGVFYLFIIFSIFPSRAFFAYVQRPAKYRILPKVPALFFLQNTKHRLNHNRFEAIKKELCEALSTSSLSPPADLRFPQNLLAYPHRSSLPL